MRKFARGVCFASVNEDSFQLTSIEFEALADREFFPVKHAVCKKLEALLVRLREKIALTTANSSLNIPEAFRLGAGKISRGENYRMYPYRVLDYPSVFEGADIFTYRTLLLWGHPPGFHLILTGKYKALFEKKLLAAGKEALSAWTLSLAGSPWEWVAEPDTGKLLADLEEREIASLVDKMPYLKLSLWIELERYAEVPETGRQQWEIFQELLFKTLPSEQ